MHYEREYTGTEADKLSRALKDCREWLGKATFNKVAKALQQDRGRTSMNFLLIQFAMMGIQGYPAYAMINTYWSPQRDLFDKVKK